MSQDTNQNLKETPPRTRAFLRLLEKYLLWIPAGAVYVGYLIHALTGSPEKIESTPLSINLTRAPFVVHSFPSKKTETTALIIFGSGDWGWGQWENDVSNQLQNAGYTVIGIDSMAYANTDYDLDILQTDFLKIIQTARDTYQLHTQPLILGGYSMGAEQAVAVAVAGGPHPPEGTVGLLLVSPGQRGRYGLRATDRVDIAPKGPNTFAMDDFSKNLGHLRVVQWHAGLDILDSTSWLDTLTVPHQEFVFPKVLHNYNYACRDFRLQLIKSVQWLLNPTLENAAAVQPPS